MCRPLHDANLTCVWHPMMYVTCVYQPSNISPLPPSLLPAAIPFPVSPSSLESEASSITSVAPQGAERPGDQLGAWVVNVPQVNVLVGDLHHALAVDVQVGTGEEEHVEAL